MNAENNGHITSLLINRTKNAGTCNIPRTRIARRNFLIPECRESGAAYYRIKIKNSGLNNTFSRILQVSPARKLAKIQLSPNPVFNKARVGFEYSGNAALLSLKIFNFGGKCFLQKNIKASNLFADISMDHLPAGNYRLSISDKYGFISGATFIVNK